LSEIAKFAISLFYIMGQSLKVTTKWLYFDKMTEVLHKRR